MTAYEPDLEAIKRLLAPKSWREASFPEVQARQYAAAAALSWYCGASTLMIDSLRPEDWRAEADGLVVFGAVSVRGIPARFARYELPLLDAPRTIVGHAVEAISRAGNGGKLLGLSRNGRPLRYGLEDLHGPVSRITGGRVRSLFDLVTRYRRYLLASDEDRSVVGWLIRQPGEDRAGSPPDLRVLKEALARTHPLLRAERSMWHAPARHRSVS